MANEYITGIGDGEDLSFVGIKHHTIADIDIEPAGIIGTPPFTTNEIPNELDTWSPKIRHGYGYDDETEYYFYSDKCTEVWGISSIVAGSGFLYSGTGWRFDPSTWAASGIPSSEIEDFKNLDTYNGSGYFSFILSDIPKEESPILVKLLPQSFELQHVDSELSSSGYLASYRINPSGIYGSGITYKVSDYIENGNYKKYTDAYDTDQDYTYPIYSKKSMAGVTGFVEIGPSGYIIPDVIQSDYYGSGTKILSNVCRHSGYTNPSEYPFAQFIPSDNRIIIPGELTNVMIEYEVSDSKEIILGDLDINPITSIDDFSNLAIIDATATTDNYLETIIAESNIIGNGSNSSIIHQSVRDSNGIPGSGIPIYMSIERDFKYYHPSSGFVSIDLDSMHEKIIGGELYTEITIPTYGSSDYPLRTNPSGVPIFDSNNMIMSIPIAENTSGVYQVQSAGTFMYSGYYNGSGLITKYDDNLINSSGYISTNSGYLVTSSGVVITDNFGSSTAKYISPDNNRRSFDSYINSILDESVSTINIIDIHPETALGTTFVGEDLIPDVREELDVILYASGYIPGSGALLLNKPLGGYSSVRFYNASDWFGYLQDTTPLLPSILGIGIDMIEGQSGYWYVEPDFGVPTTDIIAKYHSINLEAFEMNNFIEVSG